MDRSDARPCTAGPPKPSCTHCCSRDWQRKTPTWLGHEIKGSLNHTTWWRAGHLSGLQLAVFTFTCYLLLKCDLYSALHQGPTSKRVWNILLHGLMEEPLKQLDLNMTQVHYAQYNREASQTTPKTSLEALHNMYHELSKI